MLQDQWSSGLWWDGVKMGDGGTSVLFQKQTSHINLFFSETVKSCETKFHIKAYGSMGMKICF